MAPSHPETVAEKFCEKHGSFLSNGYGRAFWTRCPACIVEEEKEAKRRADEDRKSFEQAEIEERIHLRLSLSGVSGRFRRASFDAFETPTAAHAKALETCKAFAQTMQRDGGGGLWLIGPPGTGKTHLASAMALHLIRERRMGACVFGVHEVMRMLRSRFGAKESSSSAHSWETTEDVITYLSTTGLLVLDEIGVSRGSDWEAEQLFTIVDERYRMERPTILASNLPASELKPLLGDRVYDRLRDGSHIITMNWPSYRGAARER